MTTTTNSGTSGSAQLSPTEIRLRLLENGWVPLPNDCKVCRLKGWPNVEVTPEVIASWSRRERGWPDTGIRVQDDLCVIDLDIDDQVMEEVVSELEEAKPSLQSSLLRHGKGYKEAWFIRCAEPVSRLFTRRWLAPGTNAENGNVAAVEIFGSAATRQFGAIGGHTRNPDGSVKIAYRWEGPSPLDTRPSDLPELSKQDLWEVLDIVERVLERHGWAPVQRSTKGESESERVYDLNDQMVFQCSDGVDRSLAELQAAAAESGLRCSASWLEGPTAKRRDRCLVGLTHSGTVFVHENESGVTHLPVALKPTTTIADNAEHMNRVAEKLKELKDRRRNALHSEDDAFVAANKLLKLYAHCANQQACIVPIWATSTRDGIPTKAFREKYSKHKSESEPGPRGGIKIIKAADLWMDSPDRLDVEGLRLRPDMPRPTYEERGKTYVNVYSPETHEMEGGSADEGVAFLRQLLPDDAERLWFTRWLAYKFRHPAVPGPAVVFVARSHGTGRGTLGELVRRLLGARYVKTLGFDHFAGRTYQSQYNDWAADSLVVLVNESSTADNGSSYRTKHDTYERLKEIVDPRPQERHFIVKGEKAFDGISFTSYIIATNNPDALPLPADDRRFWVGTNGEPQPVEYWERFNAWMEDPANVAAFARWLEAVELEDYSPYATPPMTAGKAAMTEMAASDLDRAFSEALATLPGELFVPEQILGAIKASQAENAYDLPQDKLDPIVRKLVQRHMFRVGVKDGQNWVLRHETRKYPLYARNQRQATLWTHADQQDVRREVLRNGLPNSQKSIGEALARLPQLVAGKDVK